MHRTCLCHLSRINYCASSSILFSYSQSVPPWFIFGRVQTILYGILSRYLLLWLDFCSSYSFQKVFFGGGGFFPFSFFFRHVCLIDRVHFENSHLFVIYLVSKFSNSFLNRVFCSFLCFFISSIFHYEYGIFFNAKFYPHILAINSNILCKVSSSFSFMANIFMSFIYKKCLIFSWDFVYLLHPLHFLGI